MVLLGRGNAYRQGWFASAGNGMIVSKIHGTTPEAIPQPEEVR